MYYVQLIKMIEKFSGQNHGVIRGTLSWFQPIDSFLQKVAPDLPRPTKGELEVTAIIKLKHILNILEGNK